MQSNVKSQGVEGWPVPEANKYINIYGKTPRKMLSCSAAKSSYEQIHKYSYAYAFIKKDD